MAKENLAGGDLPGLTATVQIDPDLACAVGSGEADPAVITLAPVAPATYEPLIY